MDWQGGDIVIFKNHIGIISDRRNKNGIPYVIHHCPWQFRYEENILERRKDIIGHYRIINQTKKFYIKMIYATENKKNLCLNKAKEKLFLLESNLLI